MNISLQANKITNWKAIDYLAKLIVVYSVKSLSINFWFRLDVAEEDETALNSNRNGKILFC